MKSLRRSAGRASAFTLIELLVVVAIIALLISILLPSLSKARAQARTTLCASRIAQVAKAFLIYADDFNETPPFICIGRGTGYLGQCDPNENWLVSGQVGGTYLAAIIWDGAEANWPSNWVQTGTLFSYTRFETMYRCPEFERVRNADCVQNRFNYSRCSLGRKATFDPNHLMDTSIATMPYGFGYEGPIVKPGTAYAPSQLPIVMDEDWYAYIGYHGAMSFSWDHCDPIMDLVDSFIGDYHGSAIIGVGHIDGQWTNKYTRKRGSVAMYDCHVELVRDWLAQIGPGDRGGRAIPNPLAPGVLDANRDMLGLFCYSQQGAQSPI